MLIVFICDDRVRILTPIQYLSDCRGEIENVTSNQMPGRLTIRPKKKNSNLADPECLLHVSFVKFDLAVAEEKSKMSQHSDARDVILGRKPLTNLVVDIEDLLPVKFHQILFSCYRREVKKKYLSQSEARSAILVDGSARKKKHKLCRRH